MVNSKMYICLPQFFHFLCLSVSTVSFAAIGYDSSSSASKMT